MMVPSPVQAEISRCGGTDAPVDDQGMIAGAGEGTREAGQQSAAVVMDRGGFAMNGEAGRLDCSSSRRCDHLHPQADAKNGRAAGKPSHDLPADACALGPKGPGDSTMRSGFNDSTS